MGILYWFLSTILESIMNVFRKKAVEDSKLSWKLVVFPRAVYCCFFCLLLIVFKAGFFILDPFLIFLVIIMTFFNLIRWPLEVKLYKEEHLSSLAPYENLSQVIAIIFWFFFFKDTSLLTFGISIFIVVILLITSYDFKQKAIPKNIFLLLITKILISAKLILTWYILSKVSSSDLYISFNFAIFLAYLWLCLFTDDIRKLKENPKSFYKNIWIAAILWETSEIVSFFIIFEFWLIVWILFSFLWIATTLIFSYFFLWDKPEKKDIIMAFITTILVGLWFYFK